MKKNLTNMMCLDTYLSGLSYEEYEKVKNERDKNEQEKEEVLILFSSNLLIIRLEYKW